MAGVNTSNQEQMFGFLTWPSPFHGNVEKNSGSDSACMPYSKCPGSTSVVLPLWDSYAEVQRLHGNRGSPGACLVLSSIRGAAIDHLELFFMPYRGVDVSVGILLNHIARMQINGYYCARECDKNRACFFILFSGPSKT